MKSSAKDAGAKAEAAVPDVSVATDAELGDPKKVADNAQREAKETASNVSGAAQDAVKKVCSSSARLHWEALCSQHISGCQLSAQHHPPAPRTAPFSSSTTRPCTQTLGGLPQQAPSERRLLGAGTECCP